MSNPVIPHDHGSTLAHALEHMPDAAHFEEAADVFQQLCDGSRLRILWLLCHCEDCVFNIAAAVNMSSAAVSHHLKSLRLHGLIQSRRAGKEVYYKLAEGEKPELVHRMVDDFFQMTCPNKGLGPSC